MKLLILITLLPTLLAAQGVPDTGNSKLWELRKKMQKLHAGQARSHLEQMETALSGGDLAGADTALTAAIAQGTLTQAQIDEARGRIEALVSQQRAAMLTAARAKEEAARQQAQTAASMSAAASEPRRNDPTNEKSVAAAESATSRMAAPRESTASSSRTGVTDSRSASTTEVQRFAANFSGGYHNFTCTRDTNAGKGNMSPWLTLRAGNGKERAIQYGVPLFLSGNKGATGGLATDDRQNLEGVVMNVHFNQAGEPESIKNMSNGNHCEVKDWKVTGYGW